MAILATAAVPWDPSQILAKVAGISHAASAANEPTGASAVHRIAVSAEEIVSSAMGAGIADTADAVVVAVVEEEIDRAAAPR